MPLGRAGVTGPLSDEDLGKIAYRAWARNFHTQHAQNKMDRWNELPELLRTMWISVGQELAKEITR